VWCCAAAELPNTTPPHLEAPAPQAECAILRARIPFDVAYSINLEIEGNRTIKRGKRKHKIRSPCIPRPIFTAHIGLRLG
jgi:hypothetical protein